MLALCVVLSLAWVLAIQGSEVFDKLNQLSGKFPSFDATFQRSLLGRQNHQRITGPLKSKPNVVKTRKHKTESAEEWDDDWWDDDDWSDDHHDNYDDDNDDYKISDDGLVGFVAYQYYDGSDCTGTLTYSAGYATGTCVNSAGNYSYLIVIEDANCNTLKLVYYEQHNCIGQAFVSPLTNFTTTCTPYISGTFQTSVSGYCSVGASPHVNMDATIATVYADSNGCGGNAIAFNAYATGVCLDLYGANVTNGFEYLTCSPTGNATEYFYSSEAVCQAHTFGQANVTQLPLVCEADTFIPLRGATPKLQASVHAGVDAISFAQPVKKAAAAGRSLRGVGSVTASNVTSPSPSRSPSLSPSRSPSLSPVASTNVPTSTPATDDFGGWTNDDGVDDYVSHHFHVLLGCYVATPNPTMMPTAPTTGNASMSVVQTINGISYATFTQSSAEQTTYTNVLEDTIIEAVYGINRASFTSFVPSAASRRLLDLSVLAVSGTATVISYTVVSSVSGVTFNTMSSELTQSVSSGRFDQNLNSNAAAAGAVALIGCTSDLPTTSDSSATGDDDNGSGSSGLSAGAIAGIVIGALALLALVAAGFWFVFGRRPATPASSVKAVDYDSSSKAENPVFGIARGARPNAVEIQNM